MRVKTTTETVYQFDELNDSAKGRARDWFRSCMQSPDDWQADTVIEDAARLAALFGLDIRTRPVKLMGGGTRQEPDVYWGLDRDKGATFVGYYAYKSRCARAVAAEAPSTWTDRETGAQKTSASNTALNNIVDALVAVQRRCFFQLTASIDHGRSRSPYSCAMDITVERADRRAVSDADSDTVAQCLRDFADWIADALEKEYEWQMSDECVDENIRANEYEFDEEGNRA